jgi:D-alanyl-D-alanine dipeptidase
MKIYLYFLVFLFISCKNESNETEILIVEKDTFTMPVESLLIDEPNKTSKDTLFKILKKPQDSIIKTEPKTIVNFAQDTNFVRLENLSKDFVYDIKYATTDNFLKQKVYDCPDCFLRLKTASALINANKDFLKMGYRLKIFDCYRPHDVQKKMWAILPGTHYVANPKRGSIHNRGGAVDVTLIDFNGKELDMGTEFDFFGKEAHHTYTKHSESIQNNRNILKYTLKKHGFRSIYSEWWHYETIGAKQEKISNFKWHCD